MRLSPGPDLIGAQGKFVAGTAFGITTGQLSNAGILAILPLGYPAFAILFAVSGLTRYVDGGAGRGVRVLVVEHDGPSERGPPEVNPANGPADGPGSGFLASTNGFAFANSWPHVPPLRFRLGGPVPLELAVGDAALGLCGGMALAALDLYLAGGRAAP